MAVVKSINTDYLITNKFQSLANLTLATHTVFVDGNLIVGGNSTNVYKTDLKITDNIITVNNGETGTGVTLGIAGLTVDRGLAANTSIIWNESVGKWQLTNDGSTYVAIATTSGAGISPVVYSLVL